MSGTGSSLTRTQDRGEHATKTGWGTSGKLFTGQKDKVVTMQAVFPEPGSYTAEFSRSDNPNSNSPIFAEALLTWAVEGNYVSRRINIIDGASITGVSQAVKIILSDATPTPVIGGGPNGSVYEVACQVAPGVRGSSKQPPTLVPTSGTLPAGGPAAGGGGAFPVFAGGTTNIAVPQDAGVISVYVTVSAVAPFAEFGALVIMNNGAFTLKTYDPRDFPDWVPLSPGTTQIQLVNNTIADIKFSITFGIDG
jgi:hypothetical protein